MRSLRKLPVVIAALLALAVFAHAGSLDNPVDLNGVAQDVCVNNASGACLQNEAASGTNPTVIPDKTDLNTGIGRTGVGQLSLIAGGVEGIRVTDTGVEVVHTAAGTDDHALEIDVDAVGFGDVKGLNIDYITGAIAAGSSDSVILVNIDESASTGGEVHGLEVLSTTGSAVVQAIRVGVGVAPIHQSVGTFGNMDSALVKAVDRLTEFTSVGSDIAMFVADNDTITIGDAAKFGEIEFLLDTMTSGAGVKPTFEFSTGVGAWSVFVPTDGTNGFRNSGIIDYDPADLSGWVVGTGSEFLVRITRTANSLSTTPVEDLVQIAATTSFIWNSSGDLTINDLTTDTAAVNQLGSPVVTIDVDGATAFATTRNVVQLTCTGPETITTITGGVSGQLLTILHEDTDCTLNDTDDDTAAQLDLVGANGDLVGAEDLVILLVFTGSHWLQVSTSQN